MNIANQTYSNIYLLNLDLPSDILAYVMTLLQNWAGYCGSIASKHVGNNSTNSHLVWNSHVSPRFGYARMWWISPKCKHDLFPIWGWFVMSKPIADKAKNSFIKERRHCFPALVTSVFCSLFPLDWRSAELFKCHILWYSHPPHRTHIKKYKKGQALATPRIWGWFYT